MPGSSQVTAAAHTTGGAGPRARHSGLLLALGPPLRTRPIRLELQRTLKAHGLLLLLCSPSPLAHAPAQPPRARQVSAAASLLVTNDRTFSTFLPAEDGPTQRTSDPSDPVLLHPPGKLGFPTSDALETSGQGSGGESQGKCEFSTSRSAALSSPGGEGPTSFIARSRRSKRA